MWAGERIYITQNDRSIPESGTNPNYFVWSGFCVLVMLTVFAILIMLFLFAVEETTPAIIAALAAVFYFVSTVTVRLELLIGSIFLGLNSVLILAYILIGSILLSREGICPNPIMIFGLLLLVYPLARGCVSLYGLSSEKRKLNNLQI